MHAQHDWWGITCEKNPSYSKTRKIPIINNRAAAENSLKMAAKAGNFLE